MAICFIVISSSIAKLSCVKAVGILAGEMGTEDVLGNIFGRFYFGKKLILPITLLLHPNLIACSLLRFADFNQHIFIDQILDIS